MNKLARNYSKPKRSIRVKEGKPITEIGDQRDRWVEHFEGLLRSSAPLNPPDIEAAPKNLPVDITKIQNKIDLRKVGRGRNFHSKQRSAN